MPDDLPDHDRTAQRERNLGEQPLARLLADLNLRAADLVAASDEAVTHKMVARGCRGRWLTPNVRGKLLRALNRAAGRTFRPEELFNYAGSSRPAAEGAGGTGSVSSNRP